MKSKFVFPFCLLLVISFSIITTNLAQNCEFNISQINLVANHFKESKDNDRKLIILIARLGKKEKRLELNKRRLFSVKAYLVYSGVGKKDIITASSDKTKDLGGVEIYVNGELQHIIPANYNSDIPVGFCDSNDKYEKMFYLPKINKKSKKK